MKKLIYLMLFFGFFGCSTKPVYAQYNITKDAAGNLNDPRFFQYITNTALLKEWLRTNSFSVTAISIPGLVTNGAPKYAITNSSGDGLGLIMDGFFNFGFNVYSGGFDFTGPSEVYIGMTNGSDSFAHVVYTNALDVFWSPTLGHGTFEVDAVTNLAPGSVVNFTQVQPVYLFTPYLWTFGVPVSLTMGAKITGGSFTNTGGDYGHLISTNGNYTTLTTDMVICETAATNSTITFTGSAGQGLTLSIEGSGTNYSILGDGNGGWFYLGGTNTATPTLKTGLYKFRSDSNKTNWHSVL